MYSGVSVRALALATAGIFAAAGCGGSNGPVGQNPAPPDKQVLRVNVDTEPATLDPTQQSWAYEDNFEMIAGASGYAGVDAKSASAVRSFLNGLGLSAPDPQTFVIKLDHPAPYFKWVTSLWVAVPLKKADVDAAGADFGAVTA